MNAAGDGHVGVVHRIGFPPALLRLRPTAAALCLLVVGALAAVTACGGAGTVPGPAPDAAGPAVPVTNASGRYVALGDSYAAGPGVPTLIGNPLGCGRSSGDYPARVQAVAHYARFRDVTCSGATTGDMSRSQVTRAGSNPPQLDALTRDTTLVTLTIGGNDIGFTDILAHCLPPTTGNHAAAACRAHYTASGDDILAARIAAVAAKVTTVGKQVRLRAPTATLLIVGYPTLLPAQVACPEVPLGAGDLAYVQGVSRALNTMLHGVADHLGALYVDTATASVGHDVCAAPGTRWIEGRRPVSPAAPYHPNALGMLNSADQVLRTLHLVP